MTRNAPSYKPINFSRRDKWSIVEYPTGLPSAGDIATNLDRLLHPRYVKNHGRDVMLQQWVLDWCKGKGTSTGNGDRTTTLDYLLNETSKRFQAPNMVETGCVRSREDWNGAGNSTYLFGAYIDGLNAGKCISVDNSEHNCNFAREYCQQWPIDIVCADSVEYLKGTGEQIDVLYLDSMDADIPGHEDHGLEEFLAAEDKLSAQALVAYDDTIRHGAGWKGKGAKGVPYALSKGWKVVSEGYQVVLSK